MLFNRGIEDECVRLDMPLMLPHRVFNRPGTILFRIFLFRNIKYESLLLMSIVKALRFKKVEEETFESLFEEAFGEKKYIFIEDHHFVGCFFFELVTSLCLHFGRTKPAYICKEDRTV